MSLRIWGCSEVKLIRYSFTLLFSLYGVCAAEQGMVSEHLVLNRVYEFTYDYLLKRVSCLFGAERVKVGDGRSTFGTNNFCFFKKFKSMTLL